jgi:hypothetical protein
VRFKTPLKGVHIGPTCADGTPWDKREEAHAHIKESGSRGLVGYVCARSLASLKRHLVHELAHLAADAGHNDQWRKSVKRLGARVPAAYKKRRRT